VDVPRVRDRFADPLRERLLDPLLRERLLDPLLRERLLDPLLRERLLDPPRAVRVDVARGLAARLPFEELDRLAAGLRAVPRLEREPLVLRLEREPLALRLERLPLFVLLALPVLVVLFVVLLLLWAILASSRIVSCYSVYPLLATKSLLPATS
jgi:hypothetical protein